MNALTFHMLSLLLIFLNSEGADASEKTASINHLLADQKNVYRILDNQKGIRHFLDREGFRTLIRNDITKYSDFVDRSLAGLGIASIGGFILYYEMFDSHHKSWLYVGKPEPRLIFNHISSFLPSLAGVAMLHAIWANTEYSFNSNRAMRLLAASALSAFHFWSESGSNSAFNVSDPVDLTVGVATAWIAAMSPEIARSYSAHRARRIERQRSGQPGFCERWLRARN